MKKSFLIIFCIFIFMLCGCGREIDDMAYVVGIGIDEAEGDQYEFTFAIGDPNSINGEKGDENVLIYKSATDESIFSAGDKVSADIGQEINFSHSELLLFSETVAKEGTAQFLDSITRNLSQRPKLVPAVAENAKETLKAFKSDFEGNPEKHLKKLFEDKKAFSVDAVESREFLCRTKNIDVGTALPYVSQNIRASSMAVFVGDTLSGGFEDILAYKLICGRANDVNLDADAGGIIINQRINPVVAVNADDIPRIKINIILDGSVTHMNTEKHQLYETAERSLEQKINALLLSCSTDVFGFESKARKNFLTWEAWQKYRWGEKYKNAEFDVNVTINSEKTGLVTK